MLDLEKRPTVAEFINNSPVAHSSVVIENKIEQRTGKSIISVVFTEDFRTFLCGICTNLLTELDTKNEHHYRKIADTRYNLSVVCTTTAKVVRNMIRVLDLRIQHCRRQRDYLMNYDGDVHEENMKIDICGQTFSGISFIEHTTFIMKKRYNEPTMLAMEWARAELINSLILWSSDFE